MFACAQVAGAHVRCTIERERGAEPKTMFEHISPPAIERRITTFMVRQLVMHDGWLVARPTPNSHRNYLAKSNESCGRLLLDHGKQALRQRLVPDEVWLEMIVRFPRCGLQARDKLALSDNCAPRSAPTARCSDARSVTGASWA